MRLKYYLRGIGIGIIFTVVLLLAAASPKEGTAHLSDEEIIEAAKKLGMVEQKSLLDMTGSSTPSAAPSISPKPKDTPVPELHLSITPDPESESMLTQMAEQTPPSQTISPTPVLEPAPTTKPVPEPTLVPTPSPTPVPTPSPAPKPSKTPVPTPSPAPKLSSAPPVPTPSPVPRPSPTPVPEKEDTFVLNDDGSITIRVLEGMTSGDFARLAMEAGLVASAEDLERYFVTYEYADRIQQGEYTFIIGESFYDIAEKIAGSL